MASTTTTPTRPRQPRPEATRAGTGVGTATGTATGTGAGTGTAPGTSSSKRGLAARVSLGQVFAPVPREFLLIVSTALLLTGFGLVMILSATSATATAAGNPPYEDTLKQATFALLGIPLMFIVSRFPIAFWRRVAWPALILALAFQLLVFTPLGITANGNRNWISIGGIQAQPAEFLKLGLALWIGLILYRKRTLLSSWTHVFIPLVPVTILVLAAVMAGDDMGTAMVIALAALGALFFSGVKLRIFILPALLGLIGAAVFAAMSPNRVRRIMSFLDTDCLADYFDSCYQPLHGMWALAGGGIFGLGLGNSKEKYDWLPAAANDYIFAIVGEELGLIGCIVVLSLFALFAVGAFHIIRKTDDPFVRIVSGAITVWIVGQALINIGVVLRVFPVLGVPLPFMSQGGTSLLSVLIACGVLLSFARSLPSSAHMGPMRAVRARRAQRAPRAKIPR